MRALLLACVAPLFVGCALANLGAGERLQESVNSLNDQSRWGRIDLAIGSVAPEYRARFSETRRGWGRSIQIADAEPIDIRLSEDTDGAISVIAVTWYQLAQMDLRTTVIEQRWERDGGSFLLAAETVLDGDDALLPAIESSGGEDGADQASQDQDTEEDSELGMSPDVSPTLAVNR